MIVCDGWIDPDVGNPWLIHIIIFSGENDDLLDDKNVSSTDRLKVAAMEDEICAAVEMLLSVTREKIRGGDPNQVFLLLLSSYDSVWRHSLHWSKPSP